MSPYYQSLRKFVGTDLILMPCVAGIVHDSLGRLLLQQKADGTWSLPAGAVEPGESPYDAMTRELLEETGMKATNLTLVDCFGGSEFRHTYANGHKVEYVVLLFHCVGEIQEGAVLDSETVNLRYFSRHEFPGLQLPYPIDVLYAQPV